MKHIQLQLDFGITPQQACILCHLSADCGRCCTKCKEQGKNGSCYGQICSQENLDKQQSRWEAWMYLIKNYSCFSNLKRFLPKNIKI